ncbi:hypothetical protein [Nocardioides endophyticus]|uniref:hypothetical protein n=1 Tax=Nocardioides endophyticus TaxID=1353775 RepID=UPI0031EF79DB
MPERHILTLGANMPVRLLDHVLTATEQALHELGIARMWITREGRNLRVLAEVPLDFGDEAVDFSDGT